MNRNQVGALLVGLMLGGCGSSWSTRAGAVVLACDASPPGGPVVTVEVTALPQSTWGCEIRLEGVASPEARRGRDVYLVLDSSGSTAGASGVDVDGDGLTGVGDWRANTDPGDSTLAAELEAVRRALDAWQGQDVRVALVEYSAVIPIPPGETNEQGRIRTVQGLTADFDRVRAGLGRIQADSSVGATDYGGALLELAAEFDRSGDPAREPIAFFLSDGKPTFPRYPFDSTESPDVQWALDGAAAVAARGLPVNALEIGTFDDVGVLASVAGLTGGALLPGIGPAELLDVLATRNLDGFLSVSLANLTRGRQTDGALDASGGFTVAARLDHGVNDMELRVVLQRDGVTYTLACPFTVEASCVTLEGGPGGGGSGRRSRRGGIDDALGVDASRERPLERGGIGGNWDGFRFQPRRAPERHPATAGTLDDWGLTPCEALERTGGLGSECDEAAAQLAALLISLEVGELSPECRLDAAVVPDHATVEELIDELVRALDVGSRGRCARAAAAAAEVTAGRAFPPQPTGPVPSGPATFDCTLVLDGTDVEVTASLDAPAPGTVVGGGDDCPGRLIVAGHASAAGTSDHDVYFVVDSSGSTAGDSGRDLDGDGVRETTLEVELAAVRAMVERLDPARARVALVEFSAVIPIPPGEPSEQGRIRTVVGLTSDFPQFFAGLDAVLAAGPVGATDYGGALMELAAEHDRSGDPARNAVAFFLSDGKPTYPRFPYDSTESIDIAHAMTGAAACNDRGIRVNTYEVGVFDDLSVLLRVASETGARFYPELSGGAIVDALPGSSLVGIERVTVENRLTGESFQADVAPDGTFEAAIELAPGENEVVLVVVADSGVEVVECVTTFTGDCVWPDCAARPPELWAEDDCP